MMRPQQQKTEQLREKRVRELLARSSLVQAKSELARYEPGVALTVLTRLLRDEAQGKSRALKLIVAALVVSTAVYIGFYAVIRTFPTVFPFYIFVLLRQDKKKKGTTELSQKLFELVLPYAKQAQRSELGTLVELADLAWEAPTLFPVLLESLTYLLPRTPTDELALFSKAQRTSLRNITAKAIQKERYDKSFESLAVAGLLALESLQDPGIRPEATRARARSPQSRVGAAADEYLGALPRE